MDILQLFAYKLKDTKILFSGLLVKNTNKGRKTGF
jgi:hypothetical protein